MSIIEFITNIFKSQSPQKDLNEQTIQGNQKKNPEMINKSNQSQQMLLSLQQDLEKTFASDDLQQHCKYTMKKYFQINQNNRQELLSYKPRKQVFHYHLLLLQRATGNYKIQIALLDSILHKIYHQEILELCMLQKRMVKYLIKQDKHQKIGAEGNVKLKSFQTVYAFTIQEYLDYVPQRQAQALVDNRNKIQQLLYQKQTSKKGKVYIISKIWLDNLLIYLSNSEREIQTFPGIITHFEIAFLHEPSKKMKLLPKAQIYQISESLWQLISNNLAIVQFYYENSSNKVLQQGFQIINRQKQSNAELTRDNKHSNDQQLKYNDIELQIDGSEENMNTSNKNESMSSEQKAEHQKRMKNIQKSRRGFINIGNTCFMNSALQCLKWCQVLSFTPEQIKDSPFIRQIHYLLQLERPQVGKDWQELPHAKPSRFKRLIQNYNPLFKGNSQHDSSQFLSTAIAFIDQQTAVKKRPIPQINYQIIKTNQDLFRQFKERDHYRSKSIIDTSFTGRFLVTYSCRGPKCKGNKKLFQKFNILYVPIPEEKQRKGQSTKFKLRKCFDFFEQAQILPSWPCKTCNRETKHKKTMKLYELNKILMICLKRFSQDGRKNNAPLQLQQQIQFASANKRENLVYQLFGVVNHYGNLGQGHYISHSDAYVNNQWWRYNDSRVEKIKFSQEIAEGSLILFYRFSGRDFRIDASKQEHKENEGKE